MPKDNKIKRVLLYLFTKEIVTTISFFMAVISVILVPFDHQYKDYIDFGTLGILWSLMLVMAGLRGVGFFAKIGRFMLEQTESARSLSLVLVCLCFFLSMLITNDVALITFVPFTIQVLTMADLKKYLIKLVTLQTIAANLGSMFLPMGNPQNLYLYSHSDMELPEFMQLMLPYTAISFVLLVLGVFVLIGTEPTVVRVEEEEPLTKNSGWLTGMYGVLFVICLLTVLKIIPFYVSLGIVLMAVICMDWKTITKADYFLLLTFAFLFIFVGNVVRISVVRDAIEQVVCGNEMISAFVASQVMSNVPATILLTGFTDKYRALLVGANIGGLGTLIASMASLISFKFLDRDSDVKKGAFLLFFTVMNVMFAAVLLTVAMLL